MNKPKPLMPLIRKINRMIRIHPKTGRIKMAMIRATMITAIQIITIPASMIQASMGMATNKNICFKDTKKV